MIISTATDLNPLLDFIAANDILALDTETTGLNVRKDQIIGFSISNATTGFYVVHQEWAPVQESLLIRVSIKDCRLVLEKLRGKKLVLWNAAFDLPFIHNYFKINLLSSLWSEGMLAKHTVQEDRPFALKEVAAAVYGQSAKAEQAEMLQSIKDNGGSDKEFYKASTDKMGKYAIQDTLLTYRLNDHFLAKIEAEGLTKFYFEDEVMPLYREVTILMEQHGIQLDMPLLLSTQTEIAADIAALEAQIRSMIQPHLAAFEEWFLAKQFPPSRTGEFAQQVARYYKVDELLPKTKMGNLSLAAKAIEALPDNEFKRFMLGTERLPSKVVREVQDALQGREAVFNLQSKHHWKKVFFEQLNETPLSYTETGMPQCDDDFLESVKSKYDFIAPLLDYNRLNKIKSTYVDRFIEDAEDGKFYPTFKQHATISGRYGGDFQQLPRPKEANELSEIVLKYNNRIRKFFISKDKHVFLDADFESLEPKIFAHISQEKDLQELFSKNHDFYSTIAIQVFKLKDVSADKNADNYLGKVNKSLRQTAKAIALSIPYGKQAFGLSKDLNCPESEARRIYHDYMTAFPKLAEWMNRSKEQVLNHGYINIESGRVRHLYEASKLYKAWGSVLLDPLKVYEKWGKVPEKYKSMKFLSGKVRNAVNNANNVQCQGLAASIVNQASIAINREFNRLNINAKVISQCHDQLICECPEEQAENAAKVMQNIMENNYKISVKLTAPVVIARNLHDSH